MRTRPSWRQVAAVTAAVGGLAAAGVEGTWSSFSRLTHSTGSTFTTRSAAESRSLRASDEVSIGFVGDTSLAAGRRWSGGSVFAPVRGSLTVPDVMIANLQSPLGAGGASRGLASALGWAGVDVASLANAHSHDRGLAGRQGTVAALRAAGIRPSGRPGQITVVRRRGVSVAVVGFAPYRWAASLDDVPAAVRLVEQAGARADVVVATVHAPRGRDRDATRAFAHALVDHGADLVLGSGPALLRGAEHYRDRLIAYSLGPFAATGRPAPTGTAALGAMLRVTVHRDGRALRGRLISLRLDRHGRPAPDPARAAGRYLATLSRQHYGPAGLRLPDAGLLDLGR